MSGGARTGSGLRLQNSKHDQATYLCEACGEKIIIAIDRSAGTSQEYVEDCPVCCRPHVIHVKVDADEISVWAMRE